MPIIKNLSEISDVYIGSEKITDVYAGNDKVKSGQQELPWTQPVLSANGTIGGNAFACVASGENGNYFAWRAFNNNTNDYWGVAANPSWLEWYNHNPLKITKIVFTTGLSFVSSARYCVKNFIIQASTNNSDWIDIYTGTNTSYSEKKSITVNISNNNFYKYWRIYVSSANSGNGAIIWEVSITATQLV